jgi:Flp pilus assembly protein TadD
MICGGLLGLALLAAAPALAQPQDSQKQLLSSARIATGKGDYATAAEKYKRLRELAPENDEFLLGLARVESWRGNVDEAAGLFAEYFSRHAGDKDALLTYAYTQCWRGDNAKALEILEQYRSLAGETREYYNAKARFLAYAGRSNASLAAADKTLQKQPRDFDALFSRVIALKEARRMDEALAGLEKLKKVKPDDKYVPDLERSVTTPLRHYVQADASFVSSSDTISAGALTVEGSYTINPRLYLKAGILENSIQAKIGSGLETIGGKERLHNNAVWAGADYAASRDLWLQGRVGQADTDVTNGVATYRAAADYRPADALRVNASVDRDYYAVSPRAMSLDVARTDNQLRATWLPDLLYTVDANAGYAWFSDDNERWNLSLAPRRSVFRTGDYNLDLGVNGQWLGFSEDPGNGYYSPANYHRFALTAYSYIKISDDSGVSVIISPGIHRDNTFDRYKFSESYSAEATFGVYRDWMLKARAGYMNSIGVNGDYRAKSFGVNLTKRF